MRKYYIVLSFISIAVIASVIFFHKTELNFNQVCNIENETEFRPDAYVVINSKEKLSDFLYLQKDVRPCAAKFDLAKYSYIVVYGRKAKSMYHSYKSTYFDDKSAHYAPHFNSRVLFIEYENEELEKGIFIYKVEKDIKLREFIGV